MGGTRKSRRCDSLLWFFEPKGLRLENHGFSYLNSKSSMDGIELREADARACCGDGVQDQSQAGP